MRKLEINDAEMAIYQEIMTMYNHRLHGLLPLCKGFRCYEIAEILVHSARGILGTAFLPEWF